MKDGGWADASVSLVGAPTVRLHPCSSSLRAAGWLDASRASGHVTTCLCAIADIKCRYAYIGGVCMAWHMRASSALTSLAIALAHSRRPCAVVAVVAADLL